MYDEDDTGAGTKMNNFYLIYSFYNYVGDWDNPNKTTEKQ